jgi:C-terminal processing protease CtpA/Prc
MANKSIHDRSASGKKGSKLLRPRSKPARGSRAFLAKATKKQSKPKAGAAGATSLAQSIFQSAMSLHEFLEKANKKKWKPEQRVLLVDQAILLLEGFYVHLPMKRAMYAIDPLQRLRLLRHRLATIKSDLDFHAEMIDIFASLHDVHTSYMLPKPFADAVAVLPFRIESCLAGKKRKYVVSSVIPGCEQGSFKKGVEVVSWNGVPIERAAVIAGARSGGSNPEAQHAKGLARLTTRPLVRMSPPDEEWVTVGYRDEERQTGEARFDWRVLERPDYIKVQPATMSLEVDLLRQVRTVLFAKQTVEPDDRRLTGVFARRTIKTPRGKVGYIRIFTFNVVPNKFVARFKNLLKGLPQSGLIVDVRDNGGGHTAAGERLLQLLGATRPIEPERLYLINTPRMLELCRLQKSNRRFGPQGLKPWLKSLEQAAESGAQFSASFPYTDPKLCNKLKKPSYHGPVVVITNALSYSTTEFFAAGVQDHGLGQILGTDKRTGGGGANVKTHADLYNSFDSSDSPFKQPPHGSSFTVAFRRSQRVGKRSGHEVEDFGVSPDVIHAMTATDILGSNEDLIRRAAEILAEMREKSPLRRQSRVVTKTRKPGRSQAAKSQSRHRRKAASRSKRRAQG